MRSLSDNVYDNGLARHEPKLKLWRSAGLLVTYKCNAACEFCYYHSGPEKGGLMPVEMAVEAWESLRTLAGEGAKIHFTGGEPFLYWEHLVAILEQGRRCGLGPVDLVETNGFWATSEAIVRERLAVLDGLGVRRLKISTDPFHQQFVEIGPVRLLAEVAVETLGAERVQVRWRKYLESPGEPDRLSPAEFEQACLSAMRDYPCRFTGRAAGRLAELVAGRPADVFASQDCSGDFLGAKGVHIDPFGNVFSGTCSGIIIGNVGRRPLEPMWEQFDPREGTVIGTLFAEGPCGLLKEAEGRGYRRLDRYADKCHLCTSVRQFLFDTGEAPGVIGPSECYT